MVLIGGMLICMCMCVHACVFVCVCACECVCVRVCVCVHIYVCVCVHTRICVCLYVRERLREMLIDDADVCVRLALMISTG